MTMDEDQGRMEIENPWDLSGKYQPYFQIVLSTI